MAGGDDHVRIRTDGSKEYLPALGSVYFCSEDPMEKKRLKKEFFAENQRILEVLKEKGFSLEGDEPLSIQLGHFLCTNDMGAEEDAFPPPPVEGSDRLVPITTVDQMVRETQITGIVFDEFWHESVEEGVAYFFRWLGEPRSTVLVIWDCKRLTCIESRKIGDLPVSVVESEPIITEVVQLFCNAGFFWEGQENTEHGKPALEFTEAVAPDHLLVKSEFESELPKTKEQGEVILQVGCEGASLTIIRERNITGDWQFLSERNEVAIYDLLSEEDRSGFIACERSGYVSSFDEALRLLDHYRWFRLYPLEVHPDFLDHVLLEVTKRGGESQCTHWREQLEWRASLE